MLKTFLSATALALLIATPAVAADDARSTVQLAQAQTGSQAQTGTQTAPAAAEVRTGTSAAGTSGVTAAATQQKPGEINAQRLIGETIENPQGDNIGSINSVMIDQGGQITSVIVGVGGFLGMGEHEVAIEWNDLQVQGDGERIVANMTRDELKALPEYEFADRSQRGTVFGERGDRMATTDAAPAGRTGAATGMAGTTAAVPGAAPATGVAGAAAPGMAGTTARTATTAQERVAIDIATAKPLDLGTIRADELIGKDVMNARGEDVGEISDIVIDQQKAVFAVIDVGGFLGIGEKSVAVSFDELRMGQNDAILMSEADEDQLKQLPEYERSDQWSSVERDRPIMGDRPATNR